MLAELLAEPAVRSALLLYCCEGPSQERGVHVRYQDLDRCCHSTGASAAQTYSDKISPTYNFHFGPGQISIPGNAASETGGFISPDAFLPASYCARCHQEAYSQWRQSLHSNSFRTPFYRTSVNILLRTKGIEFTRHCDSCHNPIGGTIRRAHPRFPGGPLVR